MGKKICVIGIALLLASICNLKADAEETKTVVLTKENKITYSDELNSLGTAFRGMSPGDVRTLTIRIENDTDHIASFFLSGETIKGLEEINNSARGGAYQFSLSVGDSQEKAKPLLDTVAGGYQDSEHVSNQGLYEITELKDYQFLKEIESKESTNLYLTLKLEGEGMDSTELVDYSNAVGQMSFQFRAYYEEREPVIVDEYVTEKLPDRIEERIITVAAGAATGDTSALIILGAIFLTGITLLFVVGIRRKGGSRHEQAD